jgi:hypothetical protein
MRKDGDEFEFEARRLRRSGEFAEMAIGGFDGHFSS